jgi:hypothetical protein
VSIKRTTINFSAVFVPTVPFVSPAVELAVLTVDGEVNVSYSASNGKLVVIAAVAVSRSTVNEFAALYAPTTKAALMLNVKV